MLRLFRLTLSKVSQFLVFIFPKYFGYGSKWEAMRYSHNRDRYFAFKDAFAYTSYEKVKGDFLEFGVARGRTIIYSIYHNKEFSSEGGTKFFGFDSFQGFPKPKGVDLIFERFKEGEDNFSEKLIQKNLLNHFGINHGVTLVKGFYSEILAGKTPQDFRIKKARVISIDCDLYQSALEALTFCTQAIQEGTVILFDDYYCYHGRPDRGEQAAIHDWLTANPKLNLVPFKRYANVGMAFIVNINI